MRGGWQDRPGLWLFLLLACAYMVTFGGRLYSGDGIEMWRTARSMVRHGSLALEQDTPGRTWGYRGTDGRRYSPYALGLSVAQTPFVAAGGLAGRLLPPEAGREQVEWASAVIVNVLITAAAGLALYALAGAAGFSPRASAWTALLYGLGTMAWVYSKHDFAEPLCALCLTACAWMLVRFRNEPRIVFLLAAGALNGYSFFTKYQMVIYSPILVLWLILATDLRTRPVRGMVRPLAAFLLPGLGFGLINLWVNHARFGSWLSTGYAHQGEIFAGWTHGLTGLFGLILSPGKGILWYSPLLIAVPFAWRAFHRRAPAVSWLAGSLTAATILMFAPLWWWHGDWAWGPRYLVIPLAFMVLPLLGWLEGMPGGGAARGLRLRRRALLAGLVAAALAVNFLGIAVNFFFPLRAYSDAGMVHDQWNFLPGLSPLRYHAHVVRSWIRQAAGGEIPDFVYRQWKDGEFAETRIDTEAYLQAPDFFFFTPRESGAYQALLGAAGLLFAAGAALSWRRLVLCLEALSP